jgi:hypothetical protein
MSPTNTCVSGSRAGAAVPLLKLCKRPDAPQPLRAASHLLEGAAKPVGGGAQSTIRVAGSDTPEDRPRQESGPLPGDRGRPLELPLRRAGPGRDLDQLNSGPPAASSMPAALG